ncbi:MAG: HAD-IA family hydrolase [Thermoplasmata archaeon]|nr:HAD-IA family hydrolase [Thermoplasmata archaeon]MCK5414947.1 HAD-IA family hydrolase [Thermoplasmata archaeon]
MSSKVLSTSWRRPRTSCDGTEGPPSERKEDGWLEGPTKAGTEGIGRTHDAVLFDLFGTLVDFHSVFINTLHKVLVENELLDQAEEFRNRWQRFVFQGQAAGTFMTVREDFTSSLVTVLVDLGRDGDMAVYADQVIDEMFEQLHEAELYPEVPKVIAALEGEGIPWAIVSNVDEEDLRAIISFHDLRPLAAVSSERVRSYKPDPAIFIAALDELDLPASSVVHVGDSPLADVAGATGVGIDALWVNRHDEVYPDDLPQPGWNMPDLSGLTGLLLKG